MNLRVLGFLSAAACVAAAACATPQRQEPASRAGDPPRRAAGAEPRGPSPSPSSPARPARPAGGVDAPEDEGPAGMYSLKERWWEKGGAACPSGARLQGSPRTAKMVECVIPGGPRHGRYTFFHGRRGRKHEEGYYLKGRLHGPRARWNREGGLERVENYRIGKLHGRYATFFPDGKPKSEFFYRNGISHGRQRTWHKNGKLASEEHTDNGKRHGPQRFFYPSGRKKEEALFRQGKSHGIRTRWYDNGNKEDEGGFVNGARDGTWIAYHSNGRKKTEMTYRNGRPHGSFTMWDRNGSPVGISATWNDGTVTGLKRVSR